ncbi:MAG: hypothetical protein JWL69_4013 [Phycisphaerales bacterium]|nr:hypothetical protein [Phycisphaerales bacterium]MDB5355797.1 hypothetical protein [Phycisphaerales bacterium]
MGMGIAAFPDLIAASEDKRYSFSMTTAAWGNHSVGDACFMIIESQVESYPYGYKSREGTNGRQAIQPEYLEYARSGEGLKSWWERHKARSLPELQEEVLRWRIDQEKSIGFVDQAQRREILEPLESRLEQIRSAFPESIKPRT